MLANTLQGPGRPTANGSLGPLSSAEAGESRSRGDVLTLGPQGWAGTGAAFQTPLVWAGGTVPSPFGSGHWICPFKAMAPHSSVLAWRIPGTGEPGGLPSMGSHRVGHN